MTDELLRLQFSEARLWRLGRYHQWLLNTYQFTTFPFTSLVFSAWRFDRLAEQNWENEGGR